MLELALSLVLVCLLLPRRAASGPYALGLLERLLGVSRRCSSWCAGGAGADGGYRRRRQRASPLGAGQLVVAGVPGALVLGLLTFVLSLIPMGPPLA